MATTHPAPVARAARVEPAVDTLADAEHDRNHQRRWWTLGVLCLSLVVIGVDNTILNVALPTLVRDLSATTSQLQWIVDGYTLVFAGLLLTAGSLGDKFGRRGALGLGLVVFGTGSALSAMATSSSQLIATRSLMGLGGALIMPATLSIVTNVFRVPGERAKAISIWAGFSALGIALGPVAGGWLLEHYYWGSVFLVNIPIVIAALIGVKLWVPTSKDPSAPRLDPVGAVLSIVGLSALLYAVIQGPSEGWGSPIIVGAFAGAIVVLTAFGLWERHTDHPMLDVRFFQNARFSAASASVTFTFFALFGSLFLVTQYRQFVLGFSALQSGMRVVPLAITMMIVAPLSAKLAARFGTKIVVTSGLVITAAGLLMILGTTATTGDLLLVVATMVLGAGMGLTMAPATESIMGSLPREKAGVGSAVNDTTRQVGGALGVAVIGSVFSAGYSNQMADALAGQPIPAEAAHAVTDSVGAALHVAGQVGGPAGDALAAAARVAFVDGLHHGVVIGAAFALLGAIVAAVFLPARAADEAEAVAFEGSIADGTAEDELPDPTGELIVVSALGEV